MLHLIRKGISDDCPVCGVSEYVSCIQNITKDTPAPLQIEMDLDGGQGEVEFLEFEVMRAISRLRELRPTHTLVLVVAAVLKYRAKDQPPL